MNDRILFEAIISQFMAQFSERKKQNKKPFNDKNHLPQ